MRHDSSIELVCTVRCLNFGGTAAAFNVVTVATGPLPPVFSIAEWPPCDPRRCSGLFDVPLPAHTSMVSTEITCVDVPSVAFTCKTGAVSTLPHKQPEETSSAHLEESADRTLDRHDHGHVCSDHREAENAGPTLRPMPCRPASPTPNRTPSVTSLRWSSQDSSDLSTAATLSGDDRYSWIPCVY